MSIETSDGTMQDSAQELERAVVGRKIVSAQRAEEGYYRPVILTLDDGTKVKLREESDCCAYTSLDNFLLHPEAIDHVITSVTTKDDYNQWYIYAAGIPVMDMEVSWSEGSGYYSYGFDIEVIPVKE